MVQRLANLYKQMDDDCRIFNNLDIQELYGAAAKNPDIHYMALEINKQHYKKRRQGTKGRR
ncbi:hypothetical protein [Gudongella oleilytica]|uniref:hypothetical protein n=1 Tax=Gudongella oleilytica TaxID=1582259 RepID=UPI002A35EAD8|nr:hypothetical protein [Gudongella oleilytica]MDY0257310.1 hypothetical protein [Gudongella oleilytica]